MVSIPRERAFDSTLSLFRDPYRLISRRCQHFGTDLFETRIFGRRTICMTGRQAAELVCDESKFTRFGAAPSAIQKTLLGRGGVQMLDGDAHRHRKAMFLSLMTTQRIEQFSDLFILRWREELKDWGRRPMVCFYDAITRVLFMAACEWAGVPLRPGHLDRRKRQVMALFDGAGSLGPRHLWSRLQRKRSERWMSRVVRHIRTGELQVDASTAAAGVASYRGLDGRLLDERAAAVELLNVVRPIVAIGVFLTFVVAALEQFPEWRSRLQTADQRTRLAFVEEVRRFYPFFPAVPSRTLCEFEWNGLRNKS
jgi:fatty-acid peroxygenase